MVHLKHLLLQQFEAGLEVKSLRAHHPQLVLALHVPPELQLLLLLLKV